MFLQRRHLNDLQADSSSSSSNANRRTAIKQVLMWDDGEYARRVDGVAIIMKNELRRVLLTGENKWKSVVSEANYKREGRLARPAQCTRRVKINSVTTEKNIKKSKLVMFENDL